MDSVGQALQGSNSCRGSSILEGTGSADRRIENADRRIEKPKVTVKNRADDEQRHCGGDRLVDKILVSARHNTAVSKTFSNFYLLLC